MDEHFNVLTIKAKVHCSFKHTKEIHFTLCEIQDIMCKFNKDDNIRNYLQIMFNSLGLGLSQCKGQLI